MAYESMNFPQLFLTAQQLQEGRQRAMLGQVQLEQGRAEMEQRRAALAREAQLRHAMAAWGQGNKRPMQTLFPAEAQKLVESEVDLEAKRTALAKSQADRATEALPSTVRALRMATEVLAANPNAAPMMERRLRVMHDSGEIYLPQEQYGIVTPERLPEILSQAEQRLASTTQPPKPATPTSDAINAAAYLKYGTDVQRAMQDPRFPATLERFASLKGTKIDMGGKSELAQANVAKIQNDIIESQQALAALGRARSRFYPTFGTRGDKAKAFVAEAASLVGLATKDMARYLERREELQQILGEAHLKYQVAVTGSGGTDSQMEQIARVALDQNLPPEILRPRLARMYRALDARIEAQSMYLEKGVPTDPVKRKQFHEEYMARVQKNEKESARKRFLELRKKENMTQEQATQRLIEEGYISEEDVNGR